LKVFCFVTQINGKLIYVTNHETFVTTIEIFATTVEHFTINKEHSVKTWNIL